MGEGSNNDWFWAIQLTDEFTREADADQALLALSEQDGFLAGRTMPPGSKSSKWRLQVFFEDDSKSRSLSYESRNEEWLPDGLRHVFVRPSFLRTMSRQKTKG